MNIANIFEFLILFQTDLLGLSSGHEQWVHCADELTIPMLQKLPTLNPSSLDTDAGEFLKELRHALKNDIINNNNN